MAAKVHKSLRLDDNLVKRVERLRADNEPLSNAMCRVMAVGCDTLEGEVEHAGNTADRDESTQKIIALLEAENTRLIADNERYQKSIAEKDEQIIKALEKAHELADQSHVLIGMTQEAKRLPDNDNAGEVLDITPSDRPMTFGEWFKQRFGGK